MQAIVDNGPAGLEIDRLDRSHRVIRIRGQHLAGLPVDHIHEAVAANMDEDLARLAVDVEVEQNILIDLVIVPEIVTGPLVRIPRSRIGSAVIDEVELRVVADPAPHGATAIFPMVRWPTRDSQIL